MKFNVKASKADGARSITLDYETGATLETKVELFGAQAVNDAADDSIIIALQSNVRRWMNAGKSDAEIKELAAPYKPGVRTARVTVRPMTAAEMIAALTTGSLVLTDEQKEAMLNAATK
jgi:hypothetical protein